MDKTMQKKSGVSSLLRPSKKLRINEYQVDGPHLHVIDLTNKEEEEDQIKIKKSEIQAFGKCIDRINNISYSERESNNDAHVVFCIDFSGSMREKDVTKGKVKTSRWNAVFECADDFLTQQLHGSKDIIDHELNVSLIIFNDFPKTMFKRMPLFHDNGVSVRKEMKKICMNNVPCKGTPYGPAFEAMEYVAKQSYGEGPVMIVFLSDGRPADTGLNDLKSQTSMREYTSFNHKRYPSPGKILDELHTCFGKRLSLQFICIHKDGKEYMELLAKKYRATFHVSQLNVDEDSNDFNKIDSSGSLSDDDLELEVIGGKSVETQQRERHLSAIKRGEVVNLTSSTMRSTFRAISSSLTTMRTSSFVEMKTLKQRNVVLESLTKSSLLTAKFEATRMVLHECGSKFVVPNDEKTNGRIVKIAIHPFAQGGLRNVYRMEELPLPGALMELPKQLVAKESRHVVQYSERLRFHNETSLCQAQAVALSRDFNDTATEYNTKQLHEDNAENVISIPHVNFLETDVYRLKDPDAPGGFRYLAVEERLQGTYEKFNSNNGYVHKALSSSKIDQTSLTTKYAAVAQAFSHFTYEKSNESEMVVDIQGCGYTYTDPQLHSEKKLYGCADRGLEGIKDFFKTHTCNAYCEALNLPRRTK